MRQVILQKSTSPKKKYDAIVEVKKFLLVVPLIKITPNTRTMTERKLIFQDIVEQIKTGGI